MLNSLKTNIRSCTKCELHKLMPDGCKPVPGIGPTNAKIFFCAEALGEDESIIGEPLVGQCGQLFNKILAAANIKRDEVWLDNIVHCRPVIGKKNRPPSPSEISSCRHWVIEAVQLVNPKVIVTLGKVSTYEFLKNQLKKSFTLGPMVGQIYYNMQLTNAKIIPCQHPSHLMQWGRAELQKTIDIFKMIKILSEEN